MPNTVVSRLRSASEDGLHEMTLGLHYWRLVHLLGINDVRHRYARSKLGQFWLTLSTAIMITALSTVWALIWRQPIQTLMPSLGAGLIIWNYLAGVITDCTNVFVTQQHLYRNQKMSFAVSIYSVIYKNTWIFAHSLIIVVAFVAIFNVSINWYQLQLVPGLLLTWVTMSWSGYLIAMTCVRYRDIIQLITNWMTILFFATPVIWSPDLLAPEHQFLIDYNPLAQFLELLRHPLLGQPVSPRTWICTITIALGGAILAFPLIGRYRRRVVFWM